MFSPLPFFVRVCVLLSFTGIQTNVTSCSRYHFKELKLSCIIFWYRVFCIMPWYMYNSCFLHIHGCLECFLHFFTCSPYFKDFFTFNTFNFLIFHIKNNIYKMERVFTVHIFSYISFNLRTLISSKLMRVRWLQHSYVSRHFLLTSLIFPFVFNKFGIIKSTIYYVV